MPVMAYMKTGTRKSTVSFICICVYFYAYFLCNKTNKNKCSLSKRVDKVLYIYSMETYKEVNKVHIPAMAYMNYRNLSQIRPL